MPHGPNAPRANVVAGNGHIPTLLPHVCAPAREPSPNIPTPPSPRLALSPYTPRPISSSPCYAVQLIFCPTRMMPNPRDAAPQHWFPSFDLCTRGPQASFVPFPVFVRSYISFFFFWEKSTRKTQASVPSSADLSHIWVGKDFSSTA